MENKNILVVGSNGQLGSELKELLVSNDSFISYFVDLPDIDITSKESIDEVFEKFLPNIVINCAAYTAVDKAEEETELALKVNQLGPANLAEACLINNALLIHISTDYVFNGKGCRPYVETDSVEPVNFYGKSKVLGERDVLKVNPQTIIIRTSWLYSTYKANFVKTMIRLGQERDELGVVADQIGSPTYARDLALSIIAISNKYIDNQNIVYGLYHFSNNGVCSWYDFARKIQELTNNNCIVKPILSEQFPTPAKRPFYSVLDKTKFEQNFKISIPHWEQSLKLCIDKLTNSKN